MKKYVKASSTLPDYTEYWAYQKVKEYGYKTKVDKTSVTIFFPDGDIYTKFTLKKVPADEFGDEFYLVYDHGYNITEELDYTDTWNEAVCGCFYYFITRY